MTNVEETWGWKTQTSYVKSVRRWDDNIKVVFLERGHAVVDWIKLADGGFQWRTVVIPTGLPVPQMHSIGWPVEQVSAFHKTK
jgi:hypothetical protein